MNDLTFALCVACLLLGRMADVTPSSRFKSAKVGEDVTLDCFYDDDSTVMLYWFKQILGQKPKIMSKFYKHDSDDEKDKLTGEFRNDTRFKLEITTRKNHLKISDVQISDSATYFCITGFLYTYEFKESISLSVKGSGSNIQAVVHQSESIQPVGSVTLSCTVSTGTCDGEHSVYWFKNSEEPQPGLIYTHGDRNDQCERKPDTQTHTCVYNLSMERLNRSHAGTYYCAVAACGHIVFGDGTKVDFEEKVDYLPLVYFLSGALAFTTILVVSLAYTAQRAFKTNCCQGSESQAAAAALNVEGHQDEDNPHYAALMEHSFSRARRQTDRDGTECVYTSVKQ
ncbi:uncharacterized protein LOC128429840 isoform X2 [Pleuronectes platessa]|uniref:uncharacterized protein LOC128429840 isoform X2 n=1 Tax=Pleuronectes platessa TaxID=8262 RepID=UPI00232A1C09|nr:uncharacterized protein LOC128429840 isoform X2 [Pleuronectes platessa]